MFKTVASMRGWDGDKFENHWYGDKTQSYKTGKNQLKGEKRWKRQEIARLSLQTLQNLEVERREANKRVWEGALIVFK